MTPSLSCQQQPAARAAAENPTVVVTGIGAVSVWGWDTALLWRGLIAGQTGIAAADRFAAGGHRTQVAGEAPPAPPGLAERFSEWRRYSDADRFAVAAAVEAWRRAGQPEPTPDVDLGSEIGLFFGGSTAGMAEGEEFFQHLNQGDLRRASLQLVASHPLNSPGDAVARLLGVTGPVRSFSSACASAGLAIGAALDALRSGEVEAALVGGADSLCELTYSGFNSLRAVDSGPCRPFRGDRAGMSLGEGAGVLFLETRERAVARGAEPLAELVGSGASCDAHHMTAPHPRGSGAALAVERALADADLNPAAIDFINAHGTGTPHNDASEWHAIEQVFGDRASEICVTSTKGSVGHLLGSSGAIEAVATVQCLVARQVHPTPGLGAIDEALAVDLVTGSPRPLAELPITIEGGRTYALSTSFGFGGANSALVFARETRGATS